MKGWDQQETLKLISEYKTHRLLWDPKNPNHFNKIYKKDAWESIGQEMGKTAVDCKTKMENLLSGLRREKMKIARSIEKGTDEVYKSSWFALDSLLFLWEKNNTSNSSNTLTTPGTSVEETPEEVASLPGDPTSSQGSQSPSPSERTSIRNSAAKRRAPQTPRFTPKVKREEDYRSENAFEIHEQFANTEHDESYHFGNFVASKLRLYDASTRTAIQSDIMNVFLSANSSMYS
ncbi:hypothetical protein GE061_005796 [Apolygus lucorum]|uniref:Uncharacterized protein n=1 Tax=Apolygus lucorum TaxID=248454 RepID=A0A6A4ILH1_APOLU|nr:hypothetical protein GE061_005796 [Apolygus lucorum]